MAALLTCPSRRPLPLSGRMSWVCRKPRFPPTSPEDRIRARSARRSIRFCLVADGSRTRDALVPGAPPAGFSPLAGAAPGCRFHVGTGLWRVDLSRRKRSQLPAHQPGAGCCTGAREQPRLHSDAITVLETGEPLLALPARRLRGTQVCSAFFNTSGRWARLPSLTAWSGRFAPQYIPPLIHGLNALRRRKSLFCGGVLRCPALRSPCEWTMSPQQQWWRFRVILQNLFRVVCMDTSGQTGVLAIL